MMTSISSVNTVVSELTSTGILASFTIKHQMSTLLALDRTCQRFHRICAEQKLWFHAYQNRFSRWSNGLWYGALPKFSWRDQLRQELTTRGRWKEFGRRINTQLEVYRKARKDRLNRILAARIQQNPVITEALVPNAGADEAAIAILTEPEVISDTIGAQDEPFSMEDMEVEDDIDDTDSESDIQCSLEFNDPQQDPIRQYLCYIRDLPSDSIEFQPRLTDFLVFDYETEKSGIVACGGYTSSATNYEVLVWSFPSWQMAARIPFNQTLVSNSREELLELSWTARILVTAVKEDEIESDRWTKICIYGLTGTSMHQIDTFEMPGFRFSAWVVCALPTSLERTQGAMPIRWQDSLQVVIVGIEAGNQLFRPFIFYYNYQKPADNRLKIIMLSNEITYYIHFDPRYPNYVVTTHVNGIFCIWSAQDGTPIARISLPPGNGADIVRLTGTLYDATYSGILSRLIVTTVPIVHEDSLSNGIFIYSLSCNSSQHGFTTKVPPLEDSDSTDNTDDNNENSPTLIVNTRGLQAYPLDGMLNIPPHHAHHSYATELRETFDKTKADQAQCRVQGTLIEKFKSLIDGASQIQPLGSLMFGETRQGHMFGLDLENNEILFQVPCSVNNNMMLVGDDIILLNNYSLSRLAVDYCPTVETLEL
ncbi:hypothetical protein BDF19DRAFT_446197 [Syncephalis fuscata]|nr:hypothetical protein BDF19DRAFT_446197 [Syncephalis fuscata]